MSVWVLSLQLCPTRCDTMDCSPPGSSVHGILQARILEWVAMPSSRGSSQPRDQTCTSMSLALVGRFFTTRTTWEAHFLEYQEPLLLILVWLIIILKNALIRLLPIWDHAIVLSSHTAYPLWSLSPPPSLPPSPASPFQISFLWFFFNLFSCPLASAGTVGTVAGTN